MYRKFRVVQTSGSRDMLAERQTNRQTDTLITILRWPTKGGVNIALFSSSLRFPSPSFPPLFAFLVYK